jgi:hypothetical protein
MVGSCVGRVIYNSKLMLSGGNLVMLGLCGYTQLPKLPVKLPMNSDTLVLSVPKY